MISNESELRVTMDRIARMQTQVAELRRAETNPANYHAASSGFLAEIDRMQLEVREYLSVHPGDPSLGNAEPVAGADGGR
jgi:hypothetical protein